MKQKKNQIYLLTFLVITVFFTLPLKAQVTIGDNVAPHKFSILELITKNKDGGLRLPQLTTEERDGLNFASNPDAAQGLVIYNTDTNCLEFWNGKEWISMCSDILPPPPTVTPQTNPTLTTNDNIRITTYINMMYDFQHQKLTAYLTSGDATAYQWQMSTDGNTWYDIYGAKSADYTVPADFMYSLGDLGLDKNNTDFSSPGNNSLEIQFRCQITRGSVTDNTADANILSMLFIRTNTQGYGIDPTTGVRYLTINRSSNGTVPTTIKIALLNLGASGTGAYMNGVALNNDNGELNDAGDLGDFYQWGRVADGHEHIVWKKGVNYVDTITPMTGNGATSLPVALNTSLQVYNSNGQIDPSNTGFYGNYIYAASTDATIGSNWIDLAADNADLWGNTYYSRFTGANATTSSPISLNGASPTWTPRAQSNNPCPDGWRVPSRFEFSDIYDDTGSWSAGSSGDYGTVASGNTWSWRDIANNAIGGVIIANSSGEKVFLPATGVRLGSNGALADPGYYTFYWSSTSNVNDYFYPVAYFLYFDWSIVVAGNLTSGSTSGTSLRCVKE